MIISDINLKKFEINLKKPLWIKQRVISSRQGVLVAIKNNEGLTGYGEIAPLPGFHLENFKDAAVQIKKASNNLIGAEVNEDLALSINGQNAPFEGMGLFPSVNFGLEMAVLAIFYAQKDLKFFIKNNISKILVNKLIPGDKKISREYIKEIINSGFKSVKIKVGHNPMEDDISRVLRLRAYLPENISIMLDANASWELEEGLSFASKIGTGRIEYIEDPLKNSADYSSFYLKTGMPVAVDEKLDGFRKDFPPGGEFIKAAILKPSMLGGFYNTARMIHWASGKNIKPVLSNAFQTGLTLSMISLFAARMDLLNGPAGMDTLGGFTEDLLNKDFPLIKGEISLTEVFKCFNRININILEDL